MENNHQSFLADNYAIIDNTPKTRKRTNLAIIAYVAIFMVVSSIIITFIQLGYMGVKGYTLEQLDKNSAIYDKNIYHDVLYFSGSLGNFTTYIFGLVVVLLIAGYMLINDFKELTKIKFKTFLIYILAGYGLFMLANYASAIFQTVFNLTEEAGNEEAIVGILNSGKSNFFFMAISVVILAPIVEEIIFRKCFFNLFSRKFNTILTVLFSSLLFGAIHIITPVLSAVTEATQDPSKWGSVITQFLYLFVYSTMGVGLGLAYQYSKRNLIPVIIIHMFNNFLSILVTVLLPSV